MLPVLQTLPVELWQLDLDVTAPRLAALSALLSARELERAAKFAFGIDRRRFVAGRGQLREILGRIIATRPDVLEIAATADGKPYIAGPKTGPHFNISHSGGLGLIAVASEAEVGVDVEEVLPIGEDLEPLVLTQRERDELCKLPDRDRCEAFYRLWTCKEAVVKAWATGLLKAPASFGIHIPDGRNGRVEWMTPGDAATGPLLVQSFVPRPGFIAAIATMDNARAVILKNQT